MITIIDSNNLLFTVKGKFGPDLKVDYSKLFQPRSIVVGFEARAFENFLRETGYEVYFEAGPPDTHYANAMLMAQAARVRDDYIRLGTNDRNIVPLIRVLQGRGIYVEVIGAGIPKELRYTANKWTELREMDLCNTTA